MIQIAANKTAKVVAGHARKVVHRHSHEIIVAMGPLLADFKWQVFAISVGVISALYVYEEVKGIDST